MRGDPERRSSHDSIRETADTIDPDVVVDAVQTLVRVPSVNPTIAPDEGTGEAQVAAAAVAWLESRGVRAWLEEASPGRVNAVAEVGRGAALPLVFCAHLDTVGTSGMTIPPFEPRIDGGRLYGRGSYDMKGSAGAIMAAAVALQRQDFAGRVMLALVADEEDASAGAMDFVRRHPASACIVTEPSEQQLVLAHKGFVWAEVVTRGTAAHGSRWDLGASAIARMAPIVTALDAFDRHVLRLRTHPLVGPASMHCAVIAGGSGWSTYASECRLKVERRTIPEETPEGVIRELRELVTGTGQAADVTLVLDRPPLVCDPDAAVVRCVREAAASVTGAEPRVIGVSYWMDAAVFAAAGVPTVNYGPAGAGAHAAEEWVDVQSVVTTARVLVASARRFFA